MTKPPRTPSSAPWHRPAPTRWRCKWATNPRPRSFRIVKDPRVGATQGDLDAQFQFLIQIRDKVSETHDGINQLRRVRQQLEQWVNRAEGHPSAETVGDAAELVKGKLGQIEDRLIQSAYRGARDRLDLPARLNRKLAELTAVVANADFAPPQQVYQVFDYLSADIDQQRGGPTASYRSRRGPICQPGEGPGHTRHCDVIASPTVNQSFSRT